MEQNEIEKRLNSIDITLAKQEVVLREHVRRSTALERYVNSLDRKVIKSESFVKYSMWMLPLIIAISAVVVQIVTRYAK
jgi:hypothetical protein